MVLLLPGLCGLAVFLGDVIRIAGLCFSGKFAGQQGCKGQDVTLGVIHCTIKFENSMPQLSTIGNC